MNKLFKLAFLILFFSANLSCAEQNSSQKENRRVDFIQDSKTDTLKFTSGIRAIFQDSKGNYWLGSHREGVCRFDGKTFEYFTVNEGLSDNQVRSIQEDQSGNIWFGTAKGVSSYDGKTIKHHTAIAGEILPNAWRKTAHDLWFNAGNNTGVFRYDGQKLNYLAFPLPKIINPNDDFHVTCMAKGKDGMLWIGTYAGVFGYDGIQFTTIYDESLGFKKETEKLHIRSIFEDSKGRLWIGNNGIGVLLKVGDTISNFSEKHSLIHPTSSRSGDRSPAGTLEHVFAIGEDAEGNIWFGDRDTGAWKYDGEKITNHPIDPNLSSSMIWSIFKDHQNHLLFGMESGGVYELNGERFERKF